MDQVTVTIEPAAGTKCPRCWNYHTVRGNYLNLCDRCCIACLQGTGDWIQRGQLTQTEADTLVAGIKAAAARWRR